MELSNEEIQNLIEANKIKAISLDTNTIEAQGFNFESGLLKQLEQFLQNSHINLVVSEVIKNEVQKHMEEPIIKVGKEIDKVLKQAKRHWKLEDGVIEEIKQKIYQERQAKDIVSERIDNFIELTSLEIVEAEDNLSISNLLEKYFQSLPPFATNDKKKCEFPDAIALMSLESWARENETKIIVISNDGDWKNYCKTSDYLVYIDDLSKTLELFQLQLDNICKKIQEKYFNKELDDLASEINNAFENKLYDFDIYVEVESSYRYEEEITDLNYKKFEFEVIQKPDIIFRPINYDEDNNLVVEARIIATVDVESNFLFYVYDEGDFCVGGNAITIESDLETNVLITLFSESGEFSNDIEIIEIEILTNSFTVDFGFVDADMS